MKILALEHYVHHDEDAIPQQFSSASHVLVHSFAEIATLSNDLFRTKNLLVV